LSLSSFNVGVYTFGNGQRRPFGFSRGGIPAGVYVRYTKIGWYVTAIHAGKPFSSIGLAPLIAHVGFPIPVILALWIMLNESIGALFVGIGFLTRFAAASIALGMVGALYTSVRLGEDWLRATLYLIIFIGLIFTGPGRFSVDHLLQKKKTNRTARLNSHSASSLLN
jgi:uncharacterized membrane protein YphA (DoxX/SURF4 family)